MQSLARRLAEAPHDPWPDRPIPIALVITDLDVGGAERALASLATGLDRRRWAPSVVALGPEAELAGVLRESGIPTTCLGVDRARPIQAVNRLASFLSLVRPRLVQSFLFHANVAARLASVRLRPRPWVVGGLRVAERRKRWHLAIDRATIGLASGSVCVSEGVRSFSVETGRIPADRLVVVSNGVDAQRFDEAPGLPRSAIGVPEGARLALFVGRLDEQKGLFDLLRAASMIADRYDWHLAIVGDGPLRGPLLAAVPANLEGRIHWLGRRSDVPSLMKTADLLLLPSWWEGMPNVVLEAMAARLPVIGSRVEGTEDLVIPGETGWLVPPRDPESLAVAWREASELGPDLRPLGDRGRNRVEAEFSTGRVVARYHALWAGLLGLERNPADLPG